MGAYMAGPGGYGPLIYFVERCHPALVWIANEHKAVFDVKRASPQTVVGYRVTGEDGGISADKARRLLGRLMLEAPEADFYSLANEFLPYDTPELLALGCRGYIDAMHVAAALGVHITVGNLNTRHPRLTPENLDAMTPMLCEAARLGMPVAVHVYNDGVPAADDVAVLRALADRAPGLRIVVEEYGILNNQMVKGGAFDTFLGLDDLLDDRVIGVAVFALCSPSWPTTDYVDQLPRLIEHVQARRRFDGATALKSILQL